jgi:hypothetical protein
MKTSLSKLGINPKEEEIAKAAEIVVAGQDKERAGRIGHLGCFLIGTEDDPNRSPPTVDPEGLVVPAGVEGPGEVRCNNVNLNGGYWWVVGPDGRRRP